LYAAFEVHTELMLPESLSPDRKVRSSRWVKIPLTLHIGLMKDSPVVGILLTLDNQARDHRFRALFTGPKSDSVHVQTQADVVERKTGKPLRHAPGKLRDITHYTSIGELPMESGPSPTQFQRNFVGIGNRGKGLIIFNKGLPEYEAKPDGTLALTLLRCVGWISLGDLKSRTRLAGPEIAVPDAQCIGPHTFEYAVMPRFGPWDPTAAYLEKNTYCFPVKSMPLRKQEGDLPAALSFLRVFPPAMMVSAVKKAYESDHLIVRFFNPTDKKLDAGVSCFWKIKEAYLADINERRKKAILVKPDGRIELVVGPKKIVTLGLALENKIKKPVLNSGRIDG
jgi:mannosylglycerate hydrolase